MSPPLTWIHQDESVFPPPLLMYLGKQAPKRISALGNLDILNTNRWRCSARSSAQEI